MSLIPENILESILNKTDIVELISSYIPLKRSGRNFKAACPFHAEKTASFMVSADKQIFHCFGCGAGGNAIGFLMRYERMSFPEAARHLAGKTGIQIPSDHKETATISLNTKLYKINELALNFFHYNLIETPEGKHALEYLTKRNISLDSIKKFKIGYAPDKWDSLLKYLTNQKISLGLIEEAGLVIAKKEGGYYDRFRKRLIIPIFDVKERPLGFGARVLDNSLPKYINSPETPIYTKGEHLYGLSLAKNAIREKDQAIVVEGYMDFLACFTAGFENIVASQGTALTPNQIRLLKRFTNNIVIIFDPDAAGEMAGLRSLDLFIEQDILVKAVILDKGLDPDNYINKFGLDAFREKVDNALNLYEFKLSLLKKYCNHKNIDSKAKIAAQMLLTINKFKNEILKSEYLKKLSADLAISFESLILELGKIDRTNTPNLELTQPLARETKRNFNIDPKELLLIKLLLQDSEMILRKLDCLQPDYFQDACILNIFNKIYESGKDGKPVNISALLNSFSDEITSKFICSIVSQEEQIMDKEIVFDDCLKRIKLDRMKSRSLKLQEEIKNAEQNNDSLALEKLMQEFYSLTKKGEK